MTLPEAMTLSTVSSDNKPSARVVLLKGFSTHSSAKGGKGGDDNSFVFYTNYESVKAKEISGNPFAALTFYWVDLNRQVRIEGKLERTSSEESDDYFNSRSRGSQIGAWASPQSEVVPNKEFIRERVKHFEEKFKNIPVPRPPNWGGYRLKPCKIQFWQAKSNRLHDRFLYSLQEDNTWKIERLAP